MLPCPLTCFGCETKDSYLGPAKDSGPGPCEIFQCKKRIHSACPAISVGWGIFSSGRLHSCPCGDNLITFFHFKCRGAGSDRRKWILTRHFLFSKGRSSFQPDVSSGFIIFHYEKIKGGHLVRFYLPLLLRGPYETFMSFLTILGAFSTALFTALQRCSSLHSTVSMLVLPLRLTHS